jgi:hypothetical protein
LTEQQRKFFGAIAGGAKPYKAEEGGWLDKYEAQDGTILDGRAQQYLSGRTGDIQGANVDVNFAKNIAAARKRDEEAALREQMPKPSFVGPADTRVSTQLIKKEQAEQRARKEAQQRSALAQTFGLFTPTGSPAAGAIGAEMFVNMNPITAPAMSAGRLTQQALGENPYGFNSNGAWWENALAGLGLAGDIAGVGMIGGIGVPKNAPLSANMSSRLAQQLRPPAVTATPVKTATQLVKPATAATTAKTWQMEELPGLHLKSTMSDGAISKIVEPKTGLVNVEQALGIIGKESGGKEKVSIIKKALGDTPPQKMDYNEFRKTIQDQLVPLERQFSTKRSDYGINNLGYNRGWSADWGGSKMEVVESLPIENQTLILSNKGKFGKGSDAHGNPEETLGHIHFLRDAETPDVLTVTQIQSDAFQGKLRTMPKSKENAIFSLERQEEHAKALDDLYSKAKPRVGNDGTVDLDFMGRPFFYELPDGQVITREIFEETPISQRKINELRKIELENFEQKSLLDKSHQERYLQEIMSYAGERGMNKLRLPTSETAAKVQGYRQRDYDVVFKELEDLRNGNISDVTKLSSETKAVITGPGNTSLVDISKGTPVPRNYKDVVSDLDNNKDFASFLENKKGIKGYDPEHQTILKKYLEQPKIIKKLFGAEPKKVTDSKGNTWYEIDVPKSFKEGKGEIKAFEQGGWLDKYEQGGMVLKQKTKDNYGTKPNPNEVDVSLPPGFVGLAYNTKGRNYSPAWGGQFAMGGSLPGATGMMYARTINPAPSNGPYAKKTKASAQNGQEMKYYQEGLDFKPKTISQDGSYIYASKDIKAKTKYPYPEDDPRSRGLFTRNPNKREPIIISDPNDPRLRAYQDSLSAYEKGREIAGNLGKIFDRYYGYKRPRYESYFAKNYEAGKLKYSLDGNQGNIFGNNFPPLSQVDLNNEIDYWKTRSGDGTTGREVAKELKKYAKIKTKPYRTLMSAELPSSLVYKKPVQPIILQKKPIPIPRDVRDLGYNLPTPGVPSFPKLQEYNPDTPTKYTFTYPTGKYNEQKTMYFPTKSALKAFTQGVRGATYQEGDSWASATGTLQDGGNVDSMGYWNPDNWGKPVTIPSNEITMEGVYEPLIGISDTGDVQYMEPGEDYEFDGEYVTEYPVAKKGISVNNADAQPIEKLDQLLNFTNYNKPTKGGWLDKYN